MNPNTIREFAASFQESRFGENASTNHQSTKNLHLDAHACKRLLNALVSLAFLTKQVHLFFNTADSLAFLSKKSSDYLGGLLHSNHLWNTCNMDSRLQVITLTTLGRHGK